MRNRPAYDETEDRPRSAPVDELPLFQVPDAELSPYTLELITRELAIVAQESSSFSSDDLYDRLPQGVRETLATRYNAFGGVFQQAARSGKIERTGQYVPDASSGRARAADRAVEGGMMERANRSVETQVLIAATVLLIVCGLASFATLLHTPRWMAYGLIGLFAAKWVLVLVFDLPSEGV